MVTVHKTLRRLKEFLWNRVLGLRRVKVFLEALLLHRQDLPKPETLSRPFGAGKAFYG